MIKLFWEGLPKYVRVILTALAFLVWTPIQVYKGAKDFIHSEVHAYITPLKEIRDMEILMMKSDIATIKEDSRFTRNYLIQHGNK